MSAIATETATILRVLALIKHQAFSEEKEWRLVSNHFADLTNAEFRPGSSMLTPYLPWELPKDEWLFESILLGPTPHPVLAMQSLRAMVTKNKLAKTVLDTEIPYRVW
jgi:hypothetical protein